MVVLLTGSRSEVRIGAGLWDVPELEISSSEPAAAFAASEWRPGRRTFSCSTRIAAPQRTYIHAQAGFARTSAQSTRLMAGLRQVPR